MEFTIDVTKRQLLTQRYDYQAIMYLTQRFANIQVSRDFGKFIVEHSSRMMISDDNRPKPGCTSFQFYYDPSFKLNDNTVVQGFELTFFIIPFDPLGRNYEDLSEEEKETLGKQAGMTRCFFQVNEFQGDDGNGCIVAFIPPESFTDSSLSSQDSQQWEKGIQWQRGMMSSMFPVDELPYANVGAPLHDPRDNMELISISADTCFDYSAKNDQRCVLYFNESGLDADQHEAFTRFGGALSGVCPTTKELMLCLNFNIPEAVDFMMECSETGDEGVYEANRKEDFEQLRNDLIATLAKIDAMKFE